MIPRKHLDEARLRELWAVGVTCTEIARQIGSSRTSVSMCARRLGLPPRATCTADLPMHRIEVAYLEGMTADEIRAQLLPRFPTIGASTIRRVLRLRGVKIRRPIKRVPDMRAECVHLRRHGLDYAEIGRRLGLSTKQVGHRIRSVMGPGPRGCRPRINVRLALQMVRGGASLRETAREVGCTPQAIHYHRKAETRRAERGDMRA